MSCNDFFDSFVGVGGLTWTTYLVPLCSKLMRPVFFLIVFLIVITVPQYVLDTDALKQENSIFPFAACS